MSSSTSASTTLSEFVRSRMQGQVPIFGGDPRNGLRDFGAAVGNSTVASVNLTIDQLARQLKQLTEVRAVASTSEGGRISLLDNVTEIDAAAELSDDRIEMLLSASMIEPRDHNKYLALLKVTRDNLRKRDVAQRMQEMRKRARVANPRAMQIDNFIEDAQELETVVAPVAAIFMIPLDTGWHKQLMAAALTHESVTQGREVNRVLAFIGDLALKMLVAEDAFERRLIVADINDVVQDQQSNVMLRQVAIAHGLDKHVRVAEGVDPRSKTVLATAFEAIIGVIYMVGGHRAVKVANSRLNFYESTATPVLVQPDQFSSLDELHDRVVV